MHPCNRPKPPPEKSINDHFLLIQCSLAQGVEVRLFSSRNDYLKLLILIAQVMHC